LTKPFEHILILSDFDGTFAGAGGRIVPENIEAIERFKALGGHFTFATGRLPSMMEKVFPDFRKVVNAPLVMCNGAILFDPFENKIIAETVFDGKKARVDVRAILDRFPTLRFAVYTDDGVLLGGYTPEEVPGNRWRKINLHADSEELAIALRDHVRAAYPREYACYRSSYAFAEIVDVTVNKGSRIPFLRQYFAERGIEKSLVAGIGDFENDIALLKSADVAFCPSNAIDAVKALCDHILCDHDEGAVATMIEIIEQGKV
jgi:HAD superfamily hydrolase (TIGR01484 family)